MFAGKKTQKNAYFNQNYYSIKCARKAILLLEEENKQIGGWERKIYGNKIFLDICF